MTCKQKVRTLFPTGDESIKIPNISGLSYLPGYISKQQELQLAAAIDLEPWDTTWERRRQLYGGSYGSADGPVREIPFWGRALADRMYAEELSERPFDQMLVNEYLPGQGIALHRDYKPFDRTVVSLSLMSPCVMDFRYPERGLRESLLLDPRSLLILSDDARYQWQHGIARRKNDRWQGTTIPRARRISITFRLYKQPDE